MSYANTKNSQSSRRKLLVYSFVLLKAASFQICSSQLSDCHRGIVIDGLESAYTQFTASTLQVVLKGLNNRKHIYVVNLSDSYAALKGRQRAQREAEGKISTH